MEPIPHLEFAFQLGFDYSHESMDMYLDTLNTAHLSSEYLNNSANNNNMSAATTSSTAGLLTSSNTGANITTPAQTLQPVTRNTYYTHPSASVSTPMTIHEGVESVPVSSTPPSYRSKMTRTQLKQELMRMKTADDDRRESEQRKIQQARLNTSDSVPLSSVVVLAPNAESPHLSANLPPEVLKVSSLLENPTQYHRDTQMRQFLNENGATGGSVPPLIGGTHTSPFLLRSATQNRFQQQVTAGNQAVSAPATVELSSHFDLVAASPGAYSSLVSSVTSVGSTQEVGTDIINTILDLEDDTSDLADGFVTLKCTESRDSSAPTSATNNRRHTSSGSGSKYDDPTKIAKDRQRKDNHNQIERKRRFNINDRITELGKMLPRDGEPHHKEVGEFRFHKGNILKATVDYIKLLRKENENLHVNQKEVDSENKRLLLQIKEYEQLLVQNHIPIPESKLTWRRLDNANGLQHYLGSPPAVEVKREPPSDIPSVSTPEHSLVDIMEDELLLGMENLTGNDPMMPQTFLSDQRMDF